jgi:hypothetical protein
MLFSPQLGIKSHTKIFSCVGIWNATKDAQNYQIRGNKLDYSGCRIQVKYGNNLNNLRCQAGRHFWNKKRKYLYDKSNDLATNSMNKNIRDSIEE